jgi:hypothetical protein
VVVVVEFTHKDPHLLLEDPVDLAEVGVEEEVITFSQQMAWLTLEAVAELGRTQVQKAHLLNAADLEVQA